MKKYFLAVCLISVCTVIFVSAAELPLYLDFTGSEDSAVPVGFDSFTAGALGANKPIISIVDGYFGKSEGDVSSTIISSAGVPNNAKPNVRKVVQAPVATGQKLSVSFNIAAADYNSEKIVYATMNENKTTDNSVMLNLGKDGKMYAFGQEALSNYSTDTWYTVDFVFTGGENTFDAYVNGVLKIHSGAFLPNRDAASETLSKIYSIYYGLQLKDSNTSTAQMYFDDLYVSYGDISVDNLVELTSGIVSVDSADLIITGLPAGMDREGLLAALIIPDGASVTFLDPAGNPLPDSGLYTGVQVKVVSKNGKNSLIYTVSNMWVDVEGLTDGGVYLTSDRAVIFDISISPNEGIEKTEVYLNGILYTTLTIMPYHAEIENLPAGSYELYAKAYNNSGLSVKSGTFRFTVKQNTKPTVSFTTFTDGRKLQYAPVIHETIMAEDSDGSVTTVKFYIDGQIAAEKQEAPFNFSLSGLTVGWHTCRAVAYDNDGASAEASVSIVVLYMTTELIYDNSFSDNMDGWSIQSGPTVAISYKEYENKGKVLELDIPSGTPYLTSYGPLASIMKRGTISLEVEMMLPTTALKVSMFIVRTSYFNTDAEISGGVLKYLPTGKTMSIAAGEWHKYRYEYNLDEKTASLYVDDVLFGENRAMTADTNLSDIRFNLSGSGKICFANVKVYKATVYPYVSQVKYLNTDGKDVGGDLVGYDATRAVLYFNTKMKPETITKDSVKVYKNGEIFDNYTVAYDEKTGNAEVVFEDGISTGTAYRIRIDKSVLSDEGKPFYTEAYVDFKTGFRPYDISQWSVYKNNQPVSNIGEITRGDKVKLRADFVNTTGQVKNNIVVFAVYSGRKMTGYQIKAVSVSGAAKIFTDELVISQTNDLIIYAYVWEGIGNRVPVIKRFEMF